MAERKYFNMKKDIHPDYRPVVFMDTTTGYQFLSGSTKHSNETVEFEGETYPLIRVEISSDSHHSTLAVKNSHKQTDAWIVSTKNTVSNKQPLVVKPFQLEWLFSVFSAITSPSYLEFKKTASQGKLFNHLILLYQ